MEINVVFSGEGGAETVKKTSYRVPVGAPAGLLYLTVSDASSANLFEFQGALGRAGAVGGAGADLLNGLRSNTSAYVRVWRADAAYSMDGRDLPDPPASLAAILGRSQPGAAAQASTRGREGRGDRSSRRRKRGDGIEDHPDRGEGVKRRGLSRSAWSLRRVSRPRRKPGR